MSSVRKIAEQAGVSITTVSRALNNDPTVRAETRELVLAIANSTGYVATMGRRVTTNIGFAYTGDPTVGHQYDAAVLAGATRGVDECHFDILMLKMQRDKKAQETFTQYFMRKGVRGVVLRTVSDQRGACKAIADEGFPHVVVSERFDEPNVNYIDGDSRAASTQAVEYLISMGHRRIAFAMHDVADRDHADRFDGYKDALAGHGIPFDERLVFTHNCSLAGGATAMGLAASLADRPTAIFCADPSMGVGAIKKAHELGLRVPEDISIVGFDDTDVRFTIYPTMTAVCQDATALGFEAALALTRMLTGAANMCFQKTLPTFFEIHQSTGPAPDRARYAGLEEPSVGDVKGLSVDGTRLASG